eukprot:m.233823 g.233823  ORF g.233823 m.233823 type:complete len:302 (-) comp15249_c0_seq9:907-1812(-)
MRFLEIYVLHLVCMHQDTMDVWFDSGSSWYSVLGSDLETASDVAADVYLEGSDQHRGWFQSSLLTKIATNNDNDTRAPYRTIITHGFVLDADGKKMSKSLGNGVDPMELINGGPNAKKQPAYGADTVRLWAASTMYHGDVKLSQNAIATASENLRRIRNACRFMLGNLDGFDPKEQRVEPSQLSSLDKYMLHQVTSLDASITAYYDEFDFLKVTQTLQNFITSELSSFYFEIAKDTLYLEPRASPQRLAMQTVLYELVNFVMHASAPIACHLSEVCCSSDSLRVSSATCFLTSIFRSNSTF